MPSLPIGACSVPRCPGRATHRGKCETHYREWQQQYDRSRGSSTSRGYGASWKKRRTEFLSIPGHQTCCMAGCCERATAVDHVVSIREGRSVAV